MVRCRRPTLLKRPTCSYFGARHSPLEKTPHKAGVVRDGLMPAAVALIAMAAECRCAAALDCPEHFELCPRHRIMIAFDESVSCAADNVGHLPGWPCHA
jgi:hypothetical protein